MKHLYALLFFMFMGFSAFAQLPDGSTAPNWTLTDLNGNSHTLYSVLDQGIPAIIDFSATWCGPCWNYHQQHHLEDLYDEYGPTGTVEQDAVRVYWIESDSGTNDPCMTNSPGCTGGTQGDWTAGTDFPLFNPPNENVPAAYQINAYPTIIAVCPDRKMYETGQATKSTLVTWINGTCALDQSFFITDETCNGDGSGMIDLEVTGGFGNISYSWSNGESSEDLVGVPPGTYSCTITEGRGHTVETGDITVSGPATPVSVGSETVNDVACNGENNGNISISATGGAGGYTYMWSNGSTTQTISDLEPNTYTVVITDNDGCTAEEVYVIEEPEVLSELTNTLPAACGNNNGTIILQASGGVGPYTYDIGVDFNGSGIFQGVPPGFYSGMITDQNNCTVSFPILVEEIDGPEAVADVNGMLSCEETEITLSGEGSTEGGALFYTWTTTDGNIVSGGNTLNPIVDATGTYTLEVTDAATNCSETDEVVVTGDFTTPMSQISSAQNLDCTNLTSVLDGTGSSSGANFSYLWVTDNGNIVEGETTLMATVNAAGDYELIVTNLTNGCTSSSTVTVEQSAGVPVADAGEEQALTCAVTEVMLDGTQSSTGDEYVYSWTTDDGVIVSGADTPTPTVSASGVYLLEVLNTDNGCTSLSSVTVVLNNQLPDPVIAAPEVLTCVLTETSLDLMLEGDHTYSWTTVDGNIVSGADTENPIIDAPGEYVVEVVSLETGCSNTTSVIVEEVINEPTAGFTFENDEKTFEFTDVSDGSPTSYLWEFGDANTSTEQNPVHTYADNGTYDVCLTITNECGDSKSCSTVVVSSGSSLAFQTEVTDELCNAACQGTASIVPAAEVENYTIAITGPNGYESSEFDMSDLCAGTYTFVITNEIGETANGEFEIVEPEQLTMNTSDVVDVACNGDDSGAISIDVTGGSGTIIVTWDDGSEGTELSGLTSGEYVGTAIDENGCSEMITVTINEPTAIQLSSSEVLDITDTNPTGSIDITVEGGTPGYTYLWSNGDTTEDIDGLEVGDYTVVVTDENGCEETYGPFTVQSVINVQDIDILDNVTVMPNPASDRVQVRLEFSTSTSCTIQLINTLGQSMDTHTTAGQSVSYSQDVSDYPQGIYLVKVTVGNQSIVKKMVKQ